VCGPYGHNFKIVKLQEMIHWDGILIWDAVKGGTNGRIHTRWVPGTLFDEPTSLAMNHSRFLQIKRVLKLNDNRDSPGRADEGYDPAYKFDLIYSTMVNNINTLTKYADLDVCMDETSYAVGGYGEANSGLIGKILGKPNCNRGGQICIAVDMHRFRPRAYVHRHKLHEKNLPFTGDGPNELRMILNKLELMVQDSSTGLDHTMLDGKVLA